MTNKYHKIPATNQEAIDREIGRKCLIELDSELETICFGKIAHISHIRRKIKKIGNKYFIQQRGQLREIEAFHPAMGDRIWDRIIDWKEAQK